MSYWLWHYDLLKILDGKLPNPGHKAVARFQEHCALAADLDCMLVTQNIDNLHEEEISNSEILNRVPDQRHRQNTEANSVVSVHTPYVYEVHGNVRYMHCSNEQESHARVFHMMPSLEEFEAARAHSENTDFCLVPQCTLCGAPMKPHVLCFDEKYNEHYYRNETVKSYV